MTDRIRRTPLWDIHKELAARMVPFAGWDMPVSYSSILEESRAVRSSAGLFDISHMGRTRIHGSGAQLLLERLTTNDVAALRPGQAHYSLLTNPRGGIIDDIIVYCQGEDDFLVVINASNTSKDLDWIRAYADRDTNIEDRTEQTAMIAVQGPDAPGLVAGMSHHGLDLLDMERFTFVNTRIDNVPATVCRTGYTGEDGFELILPAEHAIEVWQRLQEDGGVPCGLGARDALRIEAGYPLYGHEIDDTTTPVEAALMWVVKLEKGEFVGRRPILEAKQRGAGRKLVGIRMAERMAPRQGYTLFAGETPVGKVTSGVFSPTSGRGIGMAYVDDPYNRTGTELQIDIRGSLLPAIVVPKKDLLKA